MRRIRVLGVLVAGMACSAAMSGCFPLPDMTSSDAVQPQEMANAPPVGILAIEAARVFSRAEAQNKLRNPRPASDEVLVEGAELYRIYCLMCHGEAGGGDGAMAVFFRRIPDLRTPYIQNYTDGLLYTVLREGGIEMPRYAEALNVGERWAVVHYLRSLKNKSR